MKKILVCDPAHFDVSYEINPWMKNQQGLVDKSLARIQWSLLVNALSEVAEIEVMEGVKGLPDMVFTANAGIVIDDIFFVSNFAHTERQLESKYVSKWAETKTELFQNVIQISHIVFEGEGDCLSAAGSYWVGSGFRSSDNVTKFKFGIDNIFFQQLKLVDPRWYHLDTAFCPLSDSTVMWYPPAFCDASKLNIQNSFQNHVILSEEDALAFAANCVVVEQNLFLPNCSDELVSTLTRLDYDVHRFDLSEFLKAGGAAKCLTLYLN